MDEISTHTTSRNRLPHRPSTEPTGAPSHAPRTPTKPDSRPDNIPLSKPAPGAAGLLGFVGLAHVAVGAIACFAPQKDVGFALDGPGNEALLQRCVGMGGILTATAALGLCQLTRVGMQDVPEGDALSLALLSAGTAGLLSLSAADTLPSTGAGWGLLAATTALPAVRILSSPAVRARMWQGITVQEAPLIWCIHQWVVLLFTTALHTELAVALQGRTPSPQVQAHNCHTRLPTDHPSTGCCWHCLCSVACGDFAGRAGAGGSQPDGIAGMAGRGRWHSDGCASNQLEPAGGE